MLLLMDCCWNHVNCCCCCWEMLLLMIGTLGDHNHWDCCKDWIVLVSVYKNGSNGEFWFKGCFGSNFIWFWISFCVWKRLGKPWNQIWALGIQNWDFGMKNGIFVTANCHNSPWRVSLLARRATWSQRAMFARHGEQGYSPRRAMWWQGACLARHGEQDHSPRRATWRQRGYSARHGELVCLGGELPQFQFFCFAFCVLFTRFCFELTFGINMKVSENFISFPMALNWFENTLWILIYDENTPSESWWILKRLMLVNAYMFVDWVVVGEHIYVNWIVNVLVIAYMSCDDELLMNSYMHICWWWCGDIVCVNICIESSHMFMRTWLMVMVTDIYIQM